MAKQNLSEHHHPREDHPVVNRRLRRHYARTQPTAGAASINQSEYMGFAIYKFVGSLQGLSIADFIGLQSQPGQEKDFWQNRLALEYAF